MVDKELIGLIGKQVERNKELIEMVENLQPEPEPKLFLLTKTNPYWDEPTAFLVRAVDEDEAFTLTKAAKCDFEIKEITLKGKSEVLYTEWTNS